MKKSKRTHLGAKLSLGLALCLTLAGLFFTHPTRAEPVPHTHTWSGAWTSDDTHHWRGCTVDGCDVTSGCGEHGYDDPCTDATCDECGYARVAEGHIYYNNCDTTCNRCGDVRTVDDHVYKNDCAAECLVCRYLRTVDAHVYDDRCDESCNVCGELREVEGHEYDHDEDETCNRCGAVRVAAGAIEIPIALEMPPDTERIPSGAVAAIAVGATMIVGVGGFSLFWFVIRKRSLAELIALITGRTS